MIIHSDPGPDRNPTTAAQLIATRPELAGVSALADALTQQAVGS
jgi:hypothetical protein